MVRLRHATRRVVGVLVAAAALLLSLPGAMASAHVQSQAAGAHPVAIILLDTSRALTGAQTEAARQAAQRYADALPPDVRVGLVTFNAQWRVVLAPTAKRSEIISALYANQRVGETAAGIYGALAAAESAVRAAGGGPGSRLLVLSEGETIPDPTVTPAFPVDMVIWSYDSDDNTAALRELAQESGGRVVTPADSAALASAFRSSAPAPSTAHTAAPAPSPAGAAWSWQLWALLACIFVSLLLIGLFLTGALHREEPARRLESQLDRHYAPRHRPRAVDDEPGEGRVAGAAVGGVARMLGSDAQQRLAWRLDLAGIARNPAEWVVLGCCASLVLIAALTVLTRNALVGVPAGALAGWLGMRLILNARIGRRRAAFAAQLPDVLQLVAGALQSGFSLPQALDGVVREDSQPAAGEFSRALAETRIGGELEAALDRVAGRMDSTDLRWSVMAIRIQREVGGNLAEVLRNTADTMRERAQMRRQVRALSAEGRLSAYILIALPILMAAYMFLARRDYLRPLYTTPVGVIMLIGSGILIVLGSLWMRQVVKVEV